MPYAPGGKPAAEEIVLNHSHEPLVRLGGGHCHGLDKRVFPELQLVFLDFDAVAGAVRELTELDPRGDVLVFLPGEREIREAAAELQLSAGPVSRRPVR